jgi:hypothetical protein
MVCDSYLSMQANESKEPTLSDVLRELKAIKADVEKLDYKFEAFQKGTDGMVRMATTIIITAGTVTILSPVVQAVAPAIKAFLGSNAA